MNYNEIKDIIATIKASDFMEFYLKQNNTEIKISRTENAAATTGASAAQVQPVVYANEPVAVPMPVLTPTTLIPDEQPRPKNGHTIKSPVVGTYYKSASPDKPPFVNVGDKVKPGDVLCIIEAMKVMNEITSDAAGVVTEILAQNEQLVEYGQELFVIG